LGRIDLQFRYAHKWGTHFFGAGQRGNK
jgi:hypothetical protein